MKCKNIVLNILLYCTIFLLCVGLFFAIFSNSNHVFALNPNTYLDVINDIYGSDLDWFYNTQYLNMFEVKNSLINFKNNTNYDWNYIKDNPIVIAVVDTGLDYEHEIFTGAYNNFGESIILDDGVISEYDVLYRDSNGDIIGTNIAFSDNNKPIDDIMDYSHDSHGTHVAGIIASLIHYCELEKYIKIMPINASYVNVSDGKNYFKRTRILGNAGALDYAVTNGAEIINMSLAAESSNSDNWNNSTKYRDISSQAIMIASAGNYGKDSKTKPYYPAANEYVVGVMNYTYGEDGSQAYVNGSSGTNYGDLYDIFAPGKEILSSVTSNFNKTKFGDTFLYGQLTGTSMSTPIVSFVAALLRLKYRLIERDKNIEIPTKHIKSFLTYRTDIISFNNKSYTKLNILDLLENDFIDDSEGQTIIKPTSIKIELVNGKTKQKINDLSPITFKAILDPIDYNTANYIKWYEYSGDGDEIPLGIGKEIKYSPHNTATTVNIEARIEIDKTIIPSNYYTITTEYFEITPTYFDFSIKETNELAKDTNIRSGEIINFTIRYSDYLDPTKNPPIIIWYVNGVYASSGLDYSFNETHPGKYEISASLNGAMAKIVSNITVEKNNEKKLKMEKWKLYLISTSIVLVLGSILFLIIHFRRKNI